jgi:hypothetical protein
MHFKARSEAPTKMKFKKSGFWLKRKTREPAIVTAKARVPKNQLIGDE